MEQLCVLLVTVPERAVGEKIARDLVSSRLAACVNRVPGLCSVYQWQGKVEEAQEELLVIKTRALLVEAVTERVQTLHPYTVPEVVALPIVGGYAPYLQWVAEETTRPA